MCQGDAEKRRSEYADLLTRYTRHQFQQRLEMTVPLLYQIRKRNYRRPMEGGFVSWCHPYGVGQHTIQSSYITSQVYHALGNLSTSMPLSITLPGFWR